MLGVLLSLASCEEIVSISRDDTYHEYFINGTGRNFWLQPWPDHAAVLLVHKKADIHAEFYDFGEKEKNVSVEVKVSARTAEYNETRLNLKSANPGILNISCVLGNAEACAVALNFVHTDPVYRTSVVIGAFALFVCLFLFVLSWTVFCGACRATRKR
jgi:hypothetical protein